MANPRNLAVIQNTNLVGVYDGVEPVGDDDDRFSSDDLGDGLVHFFLRSPGP